VTSVLISFPIVYLGLNDLTNVMDINNQRCVLLNTSFRLYGSFFSFVIPLLIMILMYTLMVRKLHQEINMKDSRSVIKSSVSELGRVSYSKNENSRRLSKRFASSEVIYFSNGDCPKTDRLERFSPKKLTLSQLSLDHTKISTSNDIKITLNQAMRGQSFSSRIDTDKLQAQTDSNRVADNFRKLAASTGNLDDSINKETCALSISSSNLKNDIVVKSTSDNQNESKALQVLGVVFIVFIITWLPFCFLNMLSTILEMNNQSTTKFSNLVVYFTYLGYFQSTLNPIIYTIFNKKYRINFIEIIKCENKKKMVFERKFKNYKFKQKGMNTSLLIKRV
jgi:hypothetical protein